MALAAATLATAIQGIDEPATGSAADQAWADAWETYFAESAAAEVAVTMQAAPLAAFKSALQFGTHPTDAATAAARFGAAVAAFWAALAASAADHWDLTPNSVIAALPPPTVATLTATLTPILAATPGATAAAKASSIAGALHAGGGVGGKVAVLTPTGAPALVPIE